MKHMNITAYTGATEVEGLTPFVSINIDTLNPDFIGVMTRNKEGEVITVLVPSEEMLRMGRDIVEKLTPPTKEELLELDKQGV